jgi:hypothetical protein
VRSALLYGRAKEQLLVSSDSLRCDEIDVTTGFVTEKLCGVQAFHDFVIAEVARLTEAMEASSSAALLVQHLFLDELRQQVSPTLYLVRDLRTQTNCRFLWRRLEEFDNSTCEELAATVARVGCMLLALAFVGMIGTVVHYKIWRHLKDNKVIGLEMMRFEKTYKEFQKKMNLIDDDKSNKEAKRRAYNQAIADMHTNALQHSEVKQFEGGAGHGHHKMADF